MKLIQVTKANEDEVWNILFGSDVDKRVQVQFEVGDLVRISKVKRMFEKSFLSNFTEEPFTVYNRMKCQVPVYKLKMMRVKS